MSELGIREKLYTVKWNFCILMIRVENQTPTGEIGCNGTFAFNVSPFEEDEMEFLASKVCTT
jgi:hypothetical protein